MNTTQQSNKTYDVIIAGGGPVGLFLACELALAKCTVLVLEKAENSSSPLKEMPFGMRGLSAPSVEAFYRRGMLNQFQIHKQIASPHMTTTAPAKKPQGGGHFAGIPLNSEKIDNSQFTYRLPGSTPNVMFTTMAEVETILTVRAGELGVEVMTGEEITNFSQTDREVIVNTHSSSFTAKWLVGCDGSRSAVRKAGGFDFAGTEPEFTGYSARVDLADGDKLGAGRITTQTGMYLRSQPDYVILQDFDGGTYHASGKPVTLEHLQEVLRRISGTDVTINKLHVATTWTDRARQATTYQNGRVLLAGDAAHIHSPLGGQGLNLGLGDAMNLGWKLAAVLNRNAPDGLLDTYFEERYPVGARVLDWSRAQVEVMKPTPQSMAVKAVIQDLMNTTDGATYFAGRITGVNLRYDLGNDDPLVGRSVPNFQFGNGTTIGDKMHNGKAILLDLSGQDGIKSIAGKFSRNLNYITQDVQDNLGFNAVLIRPDGIVAWAANGEPDLVALEKAATTWFVRD
ncbi:FAD-dependent monooxygenase [Mucilaginibacter ginkgonis]|uniref:FAD-dependent monooxygenase n=1 Tax=Mucilaginibacter ginkgonis TaxID=2682091 RepID=A0A6I4I4M9_9SPHI|nr:FAD-dependent monooxygenase [Mucilaginibacter ginkgonis]QQL48966.1 FAD-dependent monooxygenase [Mucilaginibacter ginkgonis]